MTTTPAPTVPLSGPVGLALARAVLSRPPRLQPTRTTPDARDASCLRRGLRVLPPGGTDDWAAPPLKRPLTTGDTLWSDRDGRVELQPDGSFLRLVSNSAVSLLNVGDHVTQIELSAGTLVVCVRRLDDHRAHEIDTPNLVF
jgi:hypothetical protein